MAPGRKTGGRDYQKGHQAPGPGRPAIPWDQKQAWLKIQEMRSIANVSFQEKLAKYMAMSADALVKLQKDQSLPADEMVMVKAFIRAANSASLKVLQTMKILAAGPEPKQVELSGPGGEPLSPFTGKPVGEIVAAYEEVQRQLKERECKSTGKSPRG